MVYESRAHAEAFNAAGKTDLLISVDGDNLFIGECKVWQGPAAIGPALDQLMSYSTWRDSRLALVFFVHTKVIADTVRKAMSAIEERSEFRAWASGQVAEVAWPGDDDRRARVAIIFCHLLTHGS